MKNSRPVLAGANRQCAALSPVSNSLPQRYKLGKVIGVGSYGTVYEALDTVEGRLVAVKRVTKVFGDLNNCKRLLREIAILSRMRSKHVVKILDLCVPSDLMNFKEIDIVLEIADADFRSLFQSDDFLSETQVKSLLYNLLLGVQYIHSVGVLHRDIKPANCLVNDDCSVQICDFGLARTETVFNAFVEREGSFSCISDDLSTPISPTKCPIIDVKHEGEDQQSNNNLNILLKEDHSVAFCPQTRVASLIAADGSILSSFEEGSRSSFLNENKMKTSSSDQKDRGASSDSSTAASESYTAASEGSAVDSDELLVFNKKSLKEHDSKEGGLDRDSNEFCNPQKMRSISDLREPKEEMLSGEKSFDRNSSVLTMGLTQKSHGLSETAKQKEATAEKESETEWCLLSSNDLRGNRQRFNLLGERRRVAKCQKERVYRQLTEHVATRWYRAPEIILLQKNYTNAVDMWAVGCIFGELMLMLKENNPSRIQRPALFPGSCCYPLSPCNRKPRHVSHPSVDQLEAIFKVLGTPTPSESLCYQSEEAKHLLSRYKHWPKSDLKDLFPASSKDAMTLLLKMLTFDPSERITAEEALNCPFFDDIRKPTSRIETNQAITLPFDDSKPMSAKKLRYWLLDAVRGFHSDLCLPKMLKGKSKKSVVQKHPFRQETHRMDTTCSENALFGNGTAGDKLGKQEAGHSLL